MFHPQLLNCFVFRCWSAVGRSYWLDGVGQELSLGSGCDNVGTAIHEIMHALGFWHEQSRPDRNQYVEVLWENIVEGAQLQTFLGFFSVAFSRKKSTGKSSNRPKIINFV